MFFKIFRSVFTHVKSSCFNTTAATLIICIIPSLRAETIEQFMDRMSSRAYSSAKAMGNTQLMNSINPTQAIMDQYDPSNISRQLEFQRQQQQAMARAREQAIEADRAHQEHLSSYSIDDAVRAFSNVKFVSYDLAEKDEHPLDSNIKLNLPDDFWEKYRDDRSNRSKYVQDFYSLVQSKYFNADSFPEKNHWFFYAVSASKKDGDLERILWKKEHGNFISTLAVLYACAGSPQLNFYFDESRAERIEELIERAVPNNYKADANGVDEFIDENTLINKIIVLLNAESDSECLFLQRDERVVGPFNITRIKGWIDNETLKGNDLISVSEKGAWVMISDSPLVENTTRELNKSLVITLDTSALEKTLDTSALEKTTDQVEQKKFLIDDQDATRIGNWTLSQGKVPSQVQYVGHAYIHDSDRDKGEKSVTFRKDLSPGMYDVQIAYSSHSNRATDVPVTITHMGGNTTIIVNQQKSPNIDDLFFSLGTYEFGEIGIVTISNAHTNGFVIADAVRFVSEKVETNTSPAQTDSDTVDQAKEDLSNSQTPIGRWKWGEEAHWNVTFFADGTGKAGWHDEDVLWNQDADGIVRTIFAGGHRKIQTCKLSNDGQTMTIIASNHIGDKSVGRIIYRTAYAGFTSSSESSEQLNKSTSSLVVEQEKENLSSLQTPVGRWKWGEGVSHVTFFANGTGKAGGHDEDVLWNQDADGIVRAIVARGHRKICTYKLSNDGQTMTIIANNYSNKPVGTILYKVATRP